MNQTAQWMYRFTKARVFWGMLTGCLTCIITALSLGRQDRHQIRYKIETHVQWKFFLTWSKVTVSYSSVGGEQVEIWMPASLLDVGTQWHWAKVMSHIQTWNIWCAPDSSQMQVVLFGFVRGDLHRSRTLTSVEAEEWGAGWQAMRGTYYMVAQPVLSGSEPKPPRRECAVTQCWRAVTWNVLLIENHWFIFPGNTFSDLIQDMFFYFVLFLYLTWKCVTGL